MQIITLFIAIFGGGVWLSRFVGRSEVHDSFVLQEIVELKKAVEKITLDCDKCKVWDRMNDVEHKQEILRDTLPKDMKNLELQISKLQGDVNRMGEDVKIIKDFYIKHL